MQCIRSLEDEKDIDLCRDFNDAHSVAEGIEKELQLDILKTYSCHYGQGYYFSKPVSVAEFERAYFHDARGRMPLCASMQ